MKSKPSTLLALASLGVSAHAAVEVPNDVDHVISGTVTGKLIAIDVPTLALPQVFTTEFPGGPIWATGTPTGTIAHAADNGFYVQTTVGDDYTGNAPHNRAPWEPDGTPLAEGGHYGAYNGTDPEVSYLFNLADSGIDFPDGAVINAVYTTWNLRSKDNADFSYSEGAASGSVNVEFPTAPMDDLVLRWYDDTVTGHDADFQRIITGPITVVGGDGFTIEVRRQPNTAHIDAVIIDVSGVGSAGAPFVITEIDYAPEAEPNPTVTLTWRNSGAKFYIAKYSLDMMTEGWDADLDDGIEPDEGETTTKTFELPENLWIEGDVFFRIEEQ